MKRRTSNRVLRCWWFLGILLALLSLHVSALFATTFTVTKESDDNGPCDVDDCALREAILAANALPGMDTVVLPGGVYQLSIPGAGEDGSLIGDLDIRDDLELLGSEPGGATVRGDGSDRVFNVIDATVTLSNLTITGGRAPGSGGGIRALGSEMTLQGCLVEDNQATLDGGGLLVGLSDVMVIQTTVNGNTAQRFGGGIYRLGLATPANLTLINSTVSGNFAAEGGGIYSEDNGDLSLQGSTIAYNTASFRIDDLFFAFSIEPFLTNTLIAGECGFLQADGPISNGGNIESPGSTCFLTHPTDRMNIPDPGIGVLAANGGPTPTHALLAGSPAIDSANDTLCQPTDQRGRSRPADGDGDGVAGCDVGAFERVVAAEVEIPTLGAVGLFALSLLLALAALRALPSWPSR